MSKPPASPPSSDIIGVNRDGRVGKPSKTHPDPGGALDDAKQSGAGRPDESTPPET